MKNREGKNKGNIKVKCMKTSTNKRTKKSKVEIQPWTM